MKIALLSALITLSALLTGCSQQNAACPQRACCAANGSRVLRHDVLFKFKPTATPEQIKTVVDAFRALPGKIDGIKGFEWGTDVSPEKLSQGFTHVFFLTFHSDGDRDAYLIHPAHKEFGALLGPYLDKPLVVDYWVQK